MMKALTMMKESRAYCSAIRVPGTGPLTLRGRADVAVTTSALEFRPSRLDVHFPNDYSLPRHRELESLLGADHVVDVLGRSVDVDLHPVDLAAELVAARTVVRRHRFAQIASHFCRFVQRKDEHVRAFSPSLSDLLAIDVERDGGRSEERRGGKAGRSR